MQVINQRLKTYRKHGNPKLSNVVIHVIYAKRIWFLGFSTNLVLECFNQNISIGLTNLKKLLNFQFNFYLNLPLNYTIQARTKIVGISNTTAISCPTAPSKSYTRTRTVLLFIRSTIFRLQFFCVLYIHIYILRESTTIIDIIRSVFPTSVLPLSLINVS